MNSDRRAERPWEYFCWERNKHSYNITYRTQNNLFINSSNTLNHPFINSPNTQNNPSSIHPIHRITPSSTHPIHRITLSSTIHRIPSGFWRPCNTQSQLFKPVGNKVCFTWGEMLETSIYIVYSVYSCQHIWYIVYIHVNIFSV